MLRPSKKLALALEAVVDVAFHGGLEPVQSRDIARRLGLPRRYLEQVLQQLVREGVLRGVRGPRGGYRLAKESRQTTVGEIIRVLDGHDEAADEGIPNSDSPLGTKVVIPFWEEISHRLMRQLDSATVEELCRQAAAQAIPSEAPPRHDRALAQG